MVLHLTLQCLYLDSRFRFILASNVTHYDGEDEDDDEDHDDDDGVFVLDHSFVCDAWFWGIWYSGFDTKQGKFLKVTIKKGEEQCPSHADKPLKQGLSVF